MAYDLMAKRIQVSKSFHGLRVGADIPEAVLEPFAAVRGDSLPAIQRNLGTLLQGDADSNRGALSNLATYLQLKRAPEQSLQPPAQQHQGVDLWALFEENMFDFPRGHTLPIIANAHL